MWSSVLSQRLMWLVGGGCVSEVWGSYLPKYNTVGSPTLSGEGGGAEGLDDKFCCVLLGAQSRVTLL